MAPALQRWSGVWGTRSPVASSCPIEPSFVSLAVKPVGKPDAGNPHVRFDERGWETGRRFGVSARAHSRLYKLARKTGPLPSTVAVGTTIADASPHRSIRARSRIRLLPRMPGGKARLRVRVQNSWKRSPTLQQRIQSLPGLLATLTATIQNTSPQSV